MAARTTIAAPQVVTARRSAGVWRDAFGRLRQEQPRASSGHFGVFLAVRWHLRTAAGAVAVRVPGHCAVIAQQQQAAGAVPEPGPPARHRPARPGHPEPADGRRAVSLTVAFVVQLVVLTMGVPIGASRAGSAAASTTYLMRFTDVMYAFPDLLLIILMSVAFRETWFGRLYSGLFLVFVAIGLTSWVTVARLVRGQLLSLKEMEFVEAAKALGVRDRTSSSGTCCRTRSARSSSRSRSASRAPSSPRRRSPTWASASSRRARRGATSSPTASRSSGRAPPGLPPGHHDRAWH